MPASLNTFNTVDRSCFVLFLSLSVYTNGLSIKLITIINFPIPYFNGVREHFELSNTKIKFLLSYILHKNYNDKRSFVHVHRAEGIDYN